MHGALGTWRPTTALLAISLATTAAMPFAQASSASSTPTLVALTVIASREGQPVSDLTAADVEVLDNGVARPVEAFEYVDSISGDSPEPPGDFVLVLDDLGTSSAGTSGAVSAGLALVDALGPDDRLTVMNTGPFPLIHGLSTDRTLSRSTIRQFLGQRDSSASRSEACRRSVASLRVIESALVAIAKQPSPRRAMLVVNDSRSVYWGERKEQKCSAARKVFDRVVAASSLANVPIHGIDQPPDQASAVRSDTVTPLSAAAVTKVRRPSDMPSGGLGTLARLTGGTLAALADGPHQVVRDTRQYYRLTYKPPEVRRGSGNQLRQVDVRVRRTDVSVRTRQRYLPR